MSTARLIDQDYVKTGKVRIVYKNLPGKGQESVDAATAALCAGDQGKFWEFHDQLYEASYAGKATLFTVPNFKQLATQLGLNADTFNACVDSGKYNQRVNDEMTEAKQKGVSGTPTFFINDKAIVGAQAYETFKAAIEEQLRK